MKCVLCKGWKRFVFWFKCKREERITILVPFRSDKGRRAVTWQWLERFYRDHLPEDTEIIVGWNGENPFCKTAAVNEAYKAGHGDIIVIMDADCFIDPKVILDAAHKIRVARREGKKLWFIPYRRFFRMKEWSSWLILLSSPHRPLTFDFNPPRDTYEPLTKDSVSAGHWWGALIQIMPYEAFEVAGGMDERFKGWGGEDISFMHAVDTLYGPHKTLDNGVEHLWHPSIKGAWKGTRQWAGQDRPEINDPMSGKYEQALGDKRKMRKLVKGKDVGTDS